MVVFLYFMLTLAYFQVNNLEKWLNLYMEANEREKISTWGSSVMGWCFGAMTVLGVIYHSYKFIYG